MNLEDPHLELMYNEELELFQYNYAKILPK